MVDIESSMEETENLLPPSSTTVPGAKKEAFHLSTSIVHEKLLNAEAGIGTKQPGWSTRADFNFFVQWPKLPSKVPRVNLVKFWPRFLTRRRMCCTFWVLFALVVLLFVGAGLTDFLQQRAREQRDAARELEQAENKKRDAIVIYRGHLRNAALNGTMCLTDVFNDDDKGFILPCNSTDLHQVCGNERVK